MKGLGGRVGGKKGVCNWKVDTIILNYEVTVRVPQHVFLAGSIII